MGPLGLSDGGGLHGRKMGMTGDWMKRERERESGEYPRKGWDKVR